MLANSRGYDTVVVTYTWNAVNLAATCPIFLADTAYTITRVNSRIEVAGVDVGAVTLLLRKVPSGTAIGSGTAIIGAALNLKGTAATNQLPTISVSSLAANESLAVELTGTPTTAQGVLTVTLRKSLMNAELEAIKDNWDKTTGNGREEELTRKLCDEYVAAHPELFTELANLSLEQCVESVSVFRAAGFEESQWNVEVWLLHHFEPQVIGGPARITVRIPQNG